MNFAMHNKKKLQINVETDTNNNNNKKTAQIFKLMGSLACSSHVLIINPVMANYLEIGLVPLTNDNDIIMKQYSLRAVQISSQTHDKKSKMRKMKTIF